MVTPTITLPTPPLAGQTGHITHHNALHALYDLADSAGQILVSAGADAWTMENLSDRALDSAVVHNALVDAKGDLLTATANDTPARLAVGANGSQLIAASSTATGLAWLAAPWVNVKDPQFGAVGDGVTDDRAAIQAAIDSFAGLPGTVICPLAVYGVSSPVIVKNGINLIGMGHGASTSGVTFKALAGFTGAAVVKSSSWDSGNWWHWGSIENIRINCNSVAAAGIAIHQLGEESVLRRILIGGATDSGFLLTGTHARGLLDGCNAGGNTNYGFKMTQHPTLGAPDNTNGGVLTFLSPSGDGNGVAHFYFDGSHRLTMLGIKSESNPIGLLIAGSSTGGAAPHVFMTGSFDAISAGTDMIKIQGTSAPHITSAALKANAYTNVLNDTVQTRTVPAAAFSETLGRLQWRGSSLFGTTQFVMDVQSAISWRRNDTGAVSAVLQCDSSLRTRLRTQSDGGGVVLESSGGTELLKIKPNANGGLVLTDPMDITVGATTGTKIGTATTQKLGFWNKAPVVQPSAYTQTYATADKALAAYTSDPESSTYTGLDNAQAGTPYAKLTDLNSLRAAYETLRIFTEDAVAMLNSVVDDLQLVGLVG